MIQLLHGSIFDSKCDIVVIPCDDYGGIASGIVRELIDRNLPSPKLEELTETGISFVENDNSFNFASFIAYACSVQLGDSSATPALVQNIALRLKNFCLTHGLRKVNIPLLGTGSGQLPACDSYRILQEVFARESRIQLCIYVPSLDTYEMLASSAPTAGVSAESAKVKSPRVFISYTGTDLEHRAWVKNLAHRLRENGVDARIDMFHLRPGHDLHQWMTNEVIMADKVLLICDKYYAEKADARRSGVGWETMIILGDMLSTQKQTKYIGIIHGNDIHNSLPIYIRSKYCLDWTRDSDMEKEFQNLVLYLFDCDIEPPLGDIPEYVMRKLQNS